jgi:hypothetical protein
MDYDIETKILRQVRGGEVVVRLVRVTVEPADQLYRQHFLEFGIWPKSRKIHWQDDTGRYGRLPWPADWSPDPDYTHPHYEADLVALATRLAVDEWQRRQEGGQSEIISHNIS